MKVLSIGNSFSQDAHRWLHTLAAAHGTALETVNLYIGGCSLETHWKNLLEDNAFYDYEPNGCPGTRKIGIREALVSEDWDVVTLQQVSHLSGLPESYAPYLSALAEAVRTACPKAKLYFHQTWAYENDVEHSGFMAYGNDQHSMFDCIVRTTEQAAASIGAGLIPSGRVIQYLRENTAEFDRSQGGLSLCRDGFHLSLDYGRYAAAATWLARLTGMEITVTAFEDFDGALLEKINSAVKGVVLK